jgi:hypothetical protein
MTMKRITRSGVLAGVATMVALLMAAKPATAQGSRGIDLSTGYLNVARSMNGMNVQLTSQMTRHLSFVGEIDWSRGPDRETLDPIYRDLAGLAGIRFGWQPTPRISPFLQVMAGGLHSTSEAYSYMSCSCFRTGPVLIYEPAYTTDYLAIQPGGGVTVMMTPRVGIRAQTDFQFALQSEWASIFPRTAVGAVIRLGK